MFARHFNVRENPFYAASDPWTIFPSTELQEAVQHFLYARANRDAIALLTGEVGTGKTTAIRAMQQHLAERAPHTVLQHATISPLELLEALVRAFAPNKRTRRSRIGMVQRLEEVFAALSERGDIPVVFLDEAHLFDDSVLEEIRLLTNLRHNGHPTLQVCLVGQPELAKRLRKDSFRQLRQRVSVRYEMKPMSSEDSSLYLIERIRAAGSDAPNTVFNEDAVDMIHALSGGVPREINVLASQAMMNAFVDGSFSVHGSHVRAARDHFGYEGTHVGNDPPEAREPTVAAQPAKETAPRRSGLKVGVLRPRSV